MRLWEKYLILFFLFLIPTQFALHFWPSWAFVFGLRIDLLAPAVYLTDLIALSLIVVNLVVKKRQISEYLSSYKIFIFAFSAFILVNIFFSISLYETIYRWVKTIEMLALIFIFKNNKTLKHQSIIQILIYLSVLISVIGIVQFVKGGTIGGILYYLGERSFSTSTPGIALVDIYGSAYLRAYSLFSHPNSLAGFLGVVLIFAIFSGKVRKSGVNLVTILLISTCLFLAFSRSVYVAFFLVFVLHYLGSKSKLFRFLVLSALIGSFFISIIFPFLSSYFLKSVFSFDQTINQRLILGYVSGNIISNEFFTGSGLGTFINNVPKYSGATYYSWILQPVHNVFLLVFTETGVFGFAAFCYYLFKLVIELLDTQHKYLVLVFIFIVFTGLFDHYWLTLQQNQLLLSVLLGISLKTIKHKPPRLLKIF